MLLEHSTFVIKEQVSALKLTDTYDILDPETQMPIGIARDEPPGWAKWLRLLLKKHFLPTEVSIYEAGGTKPVVSLKKSPGFLRVTVTVSNFAGQEIGRFRSKLFSLGGGFHIFGKNGAQVADVKGDWKGWNFKFLAGTEEIGVVSKKWAGLGKELFTTADTYVVSLSDKAKGNSTLSALLLAAGIAIDIVFKEA